MRLLLLLPILALPLSLGAQGPPPATLRVAASSFATVEVHLNARWIEKKWWEEDAATPT